jgi:uncharacterized OsmC-like protein
MAEVKTNESKTVALTLTLLEKYRFEIDFGDFGKILSDEPSPLGENQGPNPARLLAAAVGNCLAASLVFAIRKFREEPGQVSAAVKATLDREEGRWRVSHIAVELHLGNNANSIPHIQRALAQFEDFCVVTQSVRKGIAVDVKVIDKTGAILEVPHLNK